MEWKENKQKKEWTSDKYKIRYGENYVKGDKSHKERLSLYHCYYSVLYIAQRHSLEDAKIAVELFKEAKDRE